MKTSANMLARTFFIIYGHLSDKEKLKVLAVNGKDNVSDTLTKKGYESNPQHTNEFFAV